MSKPTQGSFERLPKWAQEEIRSLHRSVESWKERATLGPSQSDTFVQNGIQEHTPLGQGPTVEFHPKALQQNTKSVMPAGYEVRLMEDGRLRVVTTDSARILVHPQASNSFYVERDAR